ncbi:MAG: phage portal protein [Methylobacterium sp.]|uniref:phage portal protein n=1 Tax=Methylobacterium sp. TaxID=409 RepID=UPI002721CBA3|nr:phage portal protein [Methylobacterium sp.]MDO9427795.1 phage portal protein [Methylobacterium sp.]
MRPWLKSDGLVLPLQLEALECDHLPWEWTRIAPNGTGNNFDSYMRFQRMYLASCVETSYEDFANDWRGTNDRAWKAGQVKRRMMIDSEHDRLEFQVLDVVYRALVDLAIGQKLVKRPTGWSDDEVYECSYVWPASKNPNQFQEWNGWVVAVANGLASRDEAIEANGGDPWEVDRRNAEGKLRAEELGLDYALYQTPGTAQAQGGSGTPPSAKGGPDPDKPAPAPAGAPVDPTSPKELLRAAIREELDHIIDPRSQGQAYAT